MERRRGESSGEAGNGAALVTMNNGPPLVLICKSKGLACGLSLLPQAGRQRHRDCGAFPLDLSLHKFLHSRTVLASDFHPQRRLNSLLQAIRADDF
ncbi:hypothetical protein ACP70R_011122 [Stipagrostis hirtigluma subsp. patula]